MLVRPLASVLSGSYDSVRRVKILPSPLPILERRSLPHIINQVTAPMSKRMMKRMMPVMILRFLLTGFFSFFGFLDFLSVTSFIVGSLAALSSPVCSSKSKAWTGFRKSSGLAAGVVECGLACGCDCGIGELISLILMDFLVVDFLVVLGFGLAVGVEGLVLVVVLLTLCGVVAPVLERRVTKPSIDLFFSIVYNYSIMSVKLTKKQLAVLNFLEDFTEENGYSPSYREIMTGLGLSSVSAVAEHVDNLVAKGVLRKVPGAARSLEVLDYKHEETVGLFKARMMDCTEEERATLVAAAEVLGLDLD